MAAEIERRICAAPSLRRLGPSQRAAWIYRVREQRSLAFGSDAIIFGEPGWDMMLDLYCAHAQGRAVSVSGAATASHASPSTGLRYVEALERHGLIRRHPDASDRRRNYLKLTDKGLAAMDSWLAAL